MANADSPRGLVPVRRSGGGDFGELGEYRIAGGYGTAIYEGDLVKLTGSGKEIERSAAGDTTNVGVFAGCQFERPDGEVVFENKWPASQSIKTGSEVIAWVHDDPNIVFEVQADGDFQAADIGQKADIVDTSGNDTTGRSKEELDSSGIGSSGNLYILDLVRRVENDFGTNAKVEVKIDEHVFGNSLTAV
jgi:hypothetical protein